jgi:hypothetical protein
VEKSGSNSVIVLTQWKENLLLFPSLPFMRSETLGAIADRKPPRPL